MPVSESEKLEINVLGRHLSGKAEHVPIKKRKFLFRSPSPPPRSTSPCPQETDRLIKSEYDLGQGSHPDSMTRCQVVAVDGASANYLGQIAERDDDVDVKKLEKVNDHVDANEVFSDISILAAAACVNSLGQDDGIAEVDSGVEDSTAKESPKVLSNNELCYFFNGLSKEDVSSAKVSSEGTRSCIPKVAAEESMASLREDKPSSNSPSHGNIIEDTSLQDYPGPVALELLGKDDRTVGTYQLSSRDARLHWDLNTAMDAWECQFDYQVLDPKTNVADAIFKKSEDGKLGDKMENSEEIYLQGGPGVLEADIKKTLPSMSGEISQGTLDECTADTKMGETMSFNSECKNQKVNIPLVVLPEKSTHEIGDDLLENVGDSGEIYCLPDEQNIPKKMGCMESSQPVGTGCLDYVVENDVYKSDEICSPRACDSNQISVAGDKYMHHIKVSALDNADTDAQMRIDAGETTSEYLCKSTALSSRPSALGSHDDAHRICTDGMSDNCDKVVLKEHLGHNYDFDILQNDPASVGGIQQARELRVDHDSQYEDGELRESIEQTWKEYDVEDGEAEHVDYGSDDRDAYSFDAADHLVSVSEGTGCKNNQFADTYSSCSEADLSLQNVQESNSRKAFTMSKVIAAQSSKERAVKTCQPCGRPQASAKEAIDESDISGQAYIELGIGPDKLIPHNEIHAGKDDANDSNQSVDLNTIQIGRDQPANCKSSLNIATGVGGCSDRKNRIGDGIDAEDTDAKVFGSRAIKRELQPHVIGPANPSTFLRKDRPHGCRFNDVDVSESRSVRDWSTVQSFRRGRDSPHIHYRSWRDDHRVDHPEGHRGFKRRFLPSFPDPMIIPRRGPENVASMIYGRVGKDRIVAPNGTTGKPVGDGPNDHTWRPTTNSSSHGADGPVERSGSPADSYRDLGTRPAGNFSRGSATLSRGRYIRRYDSRFDDRGPRERYHRPVSDDCIESSSNYSHHLARRERSFSPIERQRDFHANRPSKSPFRSRTRSPNGWESPKGRNRTGPAGRFEHRSRSPDFRSQGRMQNMRSPHQRAGFSTGQMIGFMSMSRRHASPQRNTRWIGDQEERVVHFREQGYKQRSSVLDRRSPARIFSRDDTFSFADSQPRLKQNDYSRSMHPGRFSRMDGVGRGGPRYEGSDDDRRHGYRYSQVHPLRRRDTDGTLNRFHYDIEDGVAENHNCSEGIDSQINAAARTSREERETFSHRRDGKFSAFI